jgi:hypothetical protein
MVAGVITLLTADNVIKAFDDLGNNYNTVR